MDETAATRCHLCRIATGETSVEPVAQTARTIAIVSGEPYSRGHCVVFPRRHVPNLHECDDADLKELLPMVKRLAIALGIETYNLLQNNGALAGQTVSHAHIHLIPKADIESGLKVDRTRPRSVDQAGLISELRARFESGDVSSAS